MPEVARGWGNILKGWGKYPGKMSLGAKYVREKILSGNVEGKKLWVGGGAKILEGKCPRRENVQGNMSYRCKCPRRTNIL